MTTNEMPQPSAAEPTKDQATKAPAKAKAKPKAPGKKPEAKAPAKKVKATNPFPDEAVIKLLDKNHSYRGKRAKMFEAMKDGMTVEKYREVVAKAEWSKNLTVRSALERALERKQIQLKR